MIIIYHNPRCRKSREALAYLQSKVPENNIKIVEYLKNPLSFNELKEVIQKTGLKPEDIIRKNEAEYKDLYKGKNLSDDEWIKAMIEHPKIMQRPIVVNGDKAVIARPAEKIDEIL
jgi:arsenate reductase